jgi:predicted enzyme related to lactoylglutathione lyase
MTETGTRSDGSGKSGVDGGVGGTQPGTPNYVTIYIQVDDIDAYLKKIASMGGKTIVPKTEIPNVVTFAQFADIEGNVVGLVQG